MPITDPTDIANCTLWLEADAIAGSEGSNPTTWPDQSGGSHDFLHPPADILMDGVSPTQAGNRPPILRTNFLNGHNVLEFTRVQGGDDPHMNLGATMMTCQVDQDDIVSASGYTMFAVVYLREFWPRTSAQVGAFILTDFQTNPGIGLVDREQVDPAIINFSVAQSIDGGPNVQVVGPEWSEGDWRIMHVLHADVQLRGAVHDPVGCAQTLEAGSMFTGSWGGLFRGFILGGGRFNIDSWDGYIAEVIVYQRSLTNSEQDDVLDYLGDKYALSVTSTASLCGVAVTHQIIMAVIG